MKILWRLPEGGYAIKGGSPTDLSIASSCGFRFDATSAQFHGDISCVDKLKACMLLLASGLTITELALKHYKEAGRHVLTDIEQSHAKDADIDLPVPPGRELLPFQKAGVAYAIKRQKVLIADEMGLGKTVQAIVAVNADPSAYRVLVICPATLKINWRNEINRWNTKGLSVQAVDGGKITNLYEDVVIINFDVLTQHREILRSISWDVLIVDECHYLKSMKSIRTREVFGGIKWGKDSGGRRKMIERVDPIEARRLILMTGTPILNKPKELWPLLHVLDPDGLGSDMYAYARKYCGGFDIELPGGKKGFSWDGAAAKNTLNQLQDIMRSRFMVRRMKADVLTELPAKRRQIVALEPKPALKKLLAKESQSFEEYAAARKDSDLIDVIAAFSGISDLRKEIALKKVPYAIEYIKEVLNEQQKIVVFAHHHEVTDALVEAFGSSCVRVDGRVALQDRQNAVESFCTDSNVKIFLGGIQSAGVGITLTVASVVIFVELDWTPGNITQAEDRVHRIGQKESVVIQYLVLDGSLDEHMVDVVIKKQEIADAALNKKKEAA